MRHQLKRQFAASAAIAVLVAVGLAGTAPAAADALPQSDSSPFKAGAEMNREASQAGYYYQCSTAFAVRSALGVERLLTADHCARGAGDNTWRAGRFSATPVIGSQPATLPSPQFIDDAVMISGRNYAPRMYIGSRTSTNTREIYGAWAPVVGRNVRYSGARSGTVRYNRITHTDLTVNYGDGLVYSNLARTVNYQGLSAAGNGDSGGPVFHVNSNSQALAAGVISGIEEPFDPCQGEPSNPPTRNCSDVALFAPVTEYLNGTGYTILTPSTDS